MLCAKSATHQKCTIKIGFFQLILLFSLMLISFKTITFILIWLLALALPTFTPFPYYCPSNYCSLTLHTNALPTIALSRSRLMRSPFLLSQQSQYILSWSSLLARSLISCYPQNALLPMALPYIALQAVTLTILLSSFTFPSTALLDIRLPTNPCLSNALPADMLSDVLLPLFTFPPIMLPTN